MTGWKITGIAATLLIVLSVPLYMIKTACMAPFSGQSRNMEYGFAGSLKCADCHRKEYDKWQGSHHDHAMETADDNTVLGDFNNVTFESNGITSRFFKKDNRFFVRTSGENGEIKDFEITHTFGWYPLQQYLVPFEGGRMQCLPIAWNVPEKRWYDLNGNSPFKQGDWLYWTNAGQNWNGMCAECHSTNLRKNYDPDTGTYRTTWTDIDVGCEACHGPGSGHVEWAETPDMGRLPVTNYNLRVKTSDISSKKLVDLCAPCHSRRAILGDYTHAEPDLLDSMLPSLLTPELYFPDGQIMEEVYVHGSFIQSKMYHRDVKCSDCHDVHSAKRLQEGNNLCLQCHRAEEYDREEHHFHKKAGEKGEPIKSAEGSILFDVGSGSECVQCHMPGRNYMVIDYRPDHSIRIPRPDLSEKLNVPDACSRCHYDKSSRWSDEWITKWYGPGRKKHYGLILEAGRNHDAGACNDLVTLALDTLYPVNVRATALSLLKHYPAEDTLRAFETSLMDDEALIRRTAIETLNITDDKKRAALVAPLLYDPVKAVRIEAASKLAGESSKHLNRKQKEKYSMVLDEFIASMEYSGDFAFGRYNLGNLYKSLEKDEEVIKNYEAAIKIDNLFYPAKVNLAMFYNEKGDQDMAEGLLREVIIENPGLPEIAYSLALLLAERNKYEEAALYMGKAALGMAGSARVHYNYGLLLQYLNKDEEAERELKRATGLDPQNTDFLYALFDFYFKRERFHDAGRIAEAMVKLNPDIPELKELLDAVKMRIKSND